MISHVESFTYPHKQGTPEVGWRIQQPKRCVTADNNKHKDNHPKNQTRNIAYFILVN